MLKRGEIIHGDATYWTGTGEAKCHLPWGGVQLDVAISDVFAETCNQQLGSTLLETQGLVQAISFVVPQNSPTNRISRADAKEVFKRGYFKNKSGHVLRRNSKSGSQQIIAKALNLDVTEFEKGDEYASSTDVESGLKEFGRSGVEAIGFLSSDFVMRNRATLKELLFDCTDNNSHDFWCKPDRSRSDKFNVRNGSYPMWGPLHLIARQSDLEGQSSRSDNIREVIDYLSGTQKLAGVDEMEFYVTSGFVPQCAMHVARKNDSSPSEPFHHPTPCDCAFDATARGEDRSDCTTTPPSPPAEQREPASASPATHDNDRATTTR